MFISFEAHCKERPSLVQSPPKDTQAPPVDPCCFGRSVKGKLGLWTDGRLEHLLAPYTKINSKWMKDLNARPDTIKFLEENIGKTLWHKSQQDPLWPPPKVMEIKAKINKWNLIKCKSFCTMKKTISKVKTAFRMGENNSKWSNWQIINLKNIQAACAADADQFQKNKRPNQKMGQRTKQTFLQRRHTDG